MHKIKQLISSGVVKNASWLVAGRIVQMIISFFVGLLTARFLGPSNFGLINYAGAYTGFFAAFCTLGINSVLVKELVNNRESEGMVLGTSIVLKAISSFLSCVTIIGIVLCVDRGEKTTIAVVALCSVGVLFNVFETFNYWFQSKLMSKYSSIAVLVGYLCTSLYRIVLIVNGKSVVYFAFATSVDYIVIGVFLFTVYKKKKGAKLSFSWKYGKKLLKSSYHFIFSALMIAVYAQTDKVMLKQIIGETENGYYSTAVAVCSMWCFVLSALIDSFSPKIMEYHKAGDKDRFEKTNKSLYGIVFYLSLLVSLGFCVVAKPLIQILYGDAYLPSIAPLRIVTWYTAFSYLGTARNIWIVCENKQKYLVWIYGSAALVNVVINFLLIPLWGACGAAVASLLAQIVTTIVAPFFIRELNYNTRMVLDGISPRSIVRFLTQIREAKD